MTFFWGGQIFLDYYFSSPEEPFWTKNSKFTNHQIEVEGGGSKYPLLGISRWSGWIFSLYIVKNFQWSDLAEVFRLIDSWWGSARFHFVVALSAFGVLGVLKKWLFGKMLFRTRETQWRIFGFVKTISPKTSLNKISARNGTIFIEFNSDIQTELDLIYTINWNMEYFVRLSFA